MFDGNEDSYSPKKRKSELTDFLKENKKICLKNATVTLSIGRKHIKYLVCPFWAPVVTVF